MEPLSSLSLSLDMDQSSSLLPSGISLEWRPRGRWSCGRRRALIGPRGGGRRLHWRRGAERTAVRGSRKKWERRMSPSRSRGRGGGLVSSFGVVAFARDGDLEFTSVQDQLGWPKIVEMILPFGGSGKRTERMIFSVWGSYHVHNIPIMKCTKSLDNQYR